MPKLCTEVRRGRRTVLYLRGWAEDIIDPPTIENQITKSNYRSQVTMYCLS